MLLPLLLSYMLLMLLRHCYAHTATDAADATATEGYADCHYAILRH